MSQQQPKPKNAVPADMAISPEELMEAQREQKALKAAQENDQKPRITVNGVGITDTDINREVQYHPARDLFKAKQEAKRALVIRELLLQAALKKGLCTDKPTFGDEEDVIEQLLAQEISIPEVTEEVCCRYFDNNRRKFRTSPLYEVSHILIPAPPNKRAKRKQARELAEKLIKDLEQKPGRFDALAQQYSACSSKDSGGHMGQVVKGQTTPSFERALFKMDKGEISAAPVETRFGFHIIRVHNKAGGKELPYKDVKDWIRDFLRESSWNRAFNQYIQILAGAAEIKGFKLKEADSPLVQ